MIVVWIVLAVLFMAVELFTVGMVAIWFVAGSLVALLSAILNAPLWLQIVLFLVVSIVFFLIFYPFMKRFVRKNKQPTNADMVIGRICAVTRQIDNLNSTGAVTVDGRIWTARAMNDETIEVGQFVRVEDIQGVKLIVSPAPEAEPVSAASPQS